MYGHLFCWDIWNTLKLKLPNRWGKKKSRAGRERGRQRPVGMSPEVTVQWSPPEGAHLCRSWAVSGLGWWCSTAVSFSAEVLWFLCYSYRWDGGEGKKYEFYLVHMFTEVSNPVTLGKVRRYLREHLSPVAWFWLPLTLMGRTRVCIGASRPPGLCEGH